MTVNAACDCSAYCLASHVRAMIKVHCTPRLIARLPVLRVCAMFEGLTRVLLRTSIWFSCQFAGLYVALRAVTRLLLLLKSVLAYFCSEYSRARPSAGGSGQVIDSVYMSVFVARLADRSAVCTQPCHAVHWCVTHYRQTVCSDI